VETCAKRRVQKKQEHNGGTGESKRGGQKTHSVSEKGGEKVKGGGASHRVKKSNFPAFTSHCKCRKKVAAHVG